jgi:hypothetical protein
MKLIIPQAYLIGIKAYSASFECCYLLIRHGADVNVQDYSVDHNTPSQKCLKSYFSILKGESHHISTCPSNLLRICLYLLQSCRADPALTNREGATISDMFQANRSLVGIYTISAVL